MEGGREAERERGRQCERLNEFHLSRREGERERGRERERERGKEG